MQYGTVESGGTFANCNYSYEYCDKLANAYAHEHSDSYCHSDQYVDNGLYAGDFQRDLIQRCHDSDNYRSLVAFCTLRALLECCKF